MGEVGRPAGERRAPESPVLLEEAYSSHPIRPSLPCLLTTRSSASVLSPCPQGMLAVLIVLTGICLLGSLLAWRGQRDLQRAAKGGQQTRGLDPDMLVSLGLACVLLTACLIAKEVATETGDDHD